MLSTDPPAIQAWYEFQTGELYLHRGRLEDATRHYRAAIALAPHDPLPWLGMGEVAAARGETSDAIVWLRRVEPVVADPEVLAILGDLHLASGDLETARDYYDRVETVCRIDEVSERMYRTFLANFYADREWHLDDALALAVAELERRQDVETYETAAWVVYKTGDHQRARVLIDEALRIGTRDAEMFYRAGQIALAGGDIGQGAQWFNESKTVNSHFDPRADRIGLLQPLDE